MPDPPRLPGCISVLPLPFRFFFFFLESSRLQRWRQQKQQSSFKYGRLRSRIIMDMKRFRRQQSPQSSTDLENDGFLARGGVADRKSGPNAFRFAGILVISLTVLPLLITVAVMYRSSSSVSSLSSAAADRLVDFQTNIQQTTTQGVEDDGFSHSPDMLRDKLLGGLLAAGFEEESCLSRYQSVLYHKPSNFRPSSALTAQLRKYEALHKKCGPNTSSYNLTVQALNSGHPTGASDCSYVVWISYSGLGNRILTLAATFMYALLTDRVLLVDRGKDIGDLFCEPFRESSWLLPLDFPLSKFQSFNKKSPESYGNMLRSKVINNSIENISAGSLPAFTYLHLAHDYDDYDKLFFCEQDQLHLDKIPWLIVRTDNYFVPSLFLIPKFEQVLGRLFPKKDTLFHHLSRYLFHPSNQVWGLITRFYQAYLAQAEELIGIQIRIFDTGTGPFQYVMDQILACTLNEKLLPEVSLKDPPSFAANGRRKAVLMTSLVSGYFEKVRTMYWEHSAVSGDIMSVHQPSHEEFQQTEKQTHNMKAWAEMYLLSLTDVLVTSSWSTFGYVAQGLGGKKPWILYKPENRTAPDPPCGRAMSMEPCFHAPPFYDCKAKTGIDTGKVVPYVRHCEDVSWGLKIVGEDEL